jgi:hypothetical protein
MLTLTGSGRLAEELAASSRTIDPCGNRREFLRRV